LNLEYHYHQAGFSRGDFDNFFRLGKAARATPGIGRELALIRGYAADQQEPLSRHQAFLRADWPDALVKNLELSGFMTINLYDGSRLAQFQASYYLSDRWTIALFASGNLGASRSERGSLPVAADVIAQLTRYF
jgi:hypothetical protein